MKILGKTATRAALRGIGDMGYLKGLPIREFLDILEEVAEIDRQRRKQSK